MHGSARYIAFIQKLGDVLRLADCDALTVYLGGLDHRGTDGPFVYSWRSEFMEGMLSTLRCWLSVVVLTALVLFSKVNRRRAWLVLGWVTVSGQVNCLCMWLAT